MNQDELLAALSEQARGLGIPVSPCVCPHVRVNTRAVTRFGCCVKKGAEYTIEVSDRLLDHPAALRATLAHELLHTCRGCGNHGAQWKAYAARLGAALGCRIARTDTCQALGIPDRKPVNHLLRCTACGLEIPRTKASPLVQHPERYRCKCGGRLELDY
ncbi:MAG: SprT-like domain-containing protein [Pseudoflavonifractor sp.]